MYIRRQMEELFLETSSCFKAVLLTGLRQVGKTSMLKHLQDTTGVRTYVSMGVALASKTYRTMIGFLLSWGTRIQRNQWYPWF